MTNINKCQKMLTELAEKQGYLTFDDIYKVSDDFSLSIADFDTLNERIHLLGIIVYEKSPQPSSDEEIFDYSRTNYEVIFSEICKLAPQLEPFTKKIKSYPPPQYGELNQLLKQIANGNSFARERLIKLYMRNVLKIALSMTKNYDLDIEDAISSGFVGLIKAVDRYNLAGFSAFNPYVSLWIQQCIQRDCNPKWIDFYFPKNVEEIMFRSLQKYKIYSTGEEIGSPQYNELISHIAREINLPETDVDMSIRYFYSQKFGKVSIEDVIEQDYLEELCFEYNLVSSDEEIFEKLFYNDQCAMAEKILSTLTNKEAEVLKKRNGIDCFFPMTFKEIGSEMNLTRARIHQIECKAMEKLSQSDLKDEIKEYL